MSQYIKKPIQTMMELMPIRPYKYMEKKARPTEQLLLFKTRTGVTLKGISRIDFSFDPFHPSVSSIRDLMHTMSMKKIKRTNLSCVVRTSVVCDRSEPKMRIQLSNGEQYEYRTANLKELEVLKHMSGLTPNE